MNTPGGTVMPLEKVIGFRVFLQILAVGKVERRRVSSYSGSDAVSGVILTGVRTV